MNDWQVASQIQYLLRKATWDGSDLLFQPGSVVITASSILEEVLMDRPVPLCLISIGSAESSSHRPEELLLQEFDITVIVNVGGDKTGENTIIGKDRTGQSKGRGLLEFQSKIKETLRFLTEQQGIEFSLLGRSGADITRIGDNSAVMSRTNTFESRISDERSYENKGKFRAVYSPGLGGFLSWDAFPDRFDLTDVVVRRTAGSPPTSETDGVGVTLPAFSVIVAGGSALDTDLLSQPAGDYFYGMFSCFDEYKTAVPANYIYSEPVVQYVERP